MRTIRISAALLLLCAAAGGLQMPLKINFQGRLVDPATNLPKTGPQDITFRLYRAPTGGSPVYTETQTGVPLVNGVFSVQIGSANLLSADLFAHTSAFLSVQVGADSEMSPRQQLVMSAYAYAAAQLIGDAAVPVNAGQSYSTFTAGGSLDLAYGLDATTGVFTASGNTVYAVQASSGILMSSGTLRVAAGSHGIDATGTGITASTGVFTGAGASLPSVTTSSGIRVDGGTLDVNGSGGVEVLYGVKAATFTGDGADLSSVRVEISSVSQTNLYSVTTTEVVSSSVAIVPSRATSKVWISAQVALNRAGNALSTWTIRIRRNIGAVCTTASTLVGTANTQTVPNTAGFTQLTFVQKVDAPATTSTVYYCLTVVQNSATAQTSDERNIVAREAQ